MASRGLIISTVGAVASVAVVVIVLAWPDSGRTVPGDAAARVARPESVGIRGERIDSARRDASEEEAAPIAQPAAQPEAQPPRVDDRSRAVAPPPSGPSGPSIVPSAQNEAESVAVLAAQPRVLASVEKGLSDKRSAVRQSCWKGNLPASASFPVEASYSPEGAMTALSVSDTRDAPNVGACVRSFPSLVPPRIDAPGVAVTVRSSLTLP